MVLNFYRPCMATVSKYRFANFEADLKAAELRRNGTRLKLQLQPFQVLVALLERPQDVVTREELRQRLWPEGDRKDVSSCTTERSGASANSRT